MKSSHTSATQITSTVPAEDGLRLLREIAASGLLRCAIPTELGGLPGTHNDLAEGGLHLARTDRAAAGILWAQRSAIEALVQSRNVALMEYLLPDLLAGDRAGSMAVAAQPLIGRDTGRGWLLDGALDDVPNLQSTGCSIVAPVQLQAQLAWVLLRSEEDGLQIGPAVEKRMPPALCTAAVHARGVFFREDEYLGGQDLLERMAPLTSALALARCSVSHKG